MYLSTFQSLFTFTRVKKFSQYFYFYQSIFKHEYVYFYLSKGCVYSAYQISIFSPLDTRNWMVSTCPHRCKAVFP